MSEKDKKIYERFDKTVNQVVVYAKAASINAKVDCIYPESFMIGILTTGANPVTSSLVDMSADLEKCLRLLKEELLKKRINNETKGEINYEDLTISKQTIEVCKNANKIRNDTFPSENIGIHHVFISLLRISDFIQKLFTNENVTADKFIESFRSQDYLVEAGGESKRGSKCGSAALEAFCIDVTKQAKNNELDPIISREKEIETAITILCRRNKNNPILLGAPGVGKTAIVEGLAQRIVSGTVPKHLIGCKVYSLSLSSLVAGTKFRGEFEERIQGLVNEIQKSKDCILFIDEIHTLIGAGSASGGSLDASNILKPFLARSDLRCIGATTLDEYKKYFSKDGALARRFQQIIIEEPNKEQMKQILAGIKPKLEEYHKCIITSDAIDSVITLSDRYLKDRNFPDKAIDCLDMCCAKHAWADGKEGPAIVPKDIAIVISEQCGIPIEVILWDDNERISKIESILTSRIVGQKKAIDVVCKTLKNAYSGIRNPDKPIGSFVFGGQSGTGKTYTAKEMAKAVFGKDSSFIRLDMTEFSEPHSVSKLIGSPPGYVGFQETDIFIDKIKRKPYCLVLLDELEKAHPDVIKLFLQVMSDGTMTDSSGNKADLKNIVLIMTGNFGMDNLNKGSLGFSGDKKADLFEEEQSRLISYCKDRYGAEFINRVDEFVPFTQLGEDDLKIIIKIRLGEISSRIEGRNCRLEFSDEVYDLIIKLGKSEHGKNAAILNRIISKKVEPCISDALMSLDKNFHVISVVVNNNNFEYTLKDS